MLSLVHHIPTESSTNSLNCEKRSGRDILAVFTSSMNHIQNTHRTSSKYYFWKNTMEKSEWELATGLPRLLRNRLGERQTIALATR